MQTHDFKQGSAEWHAHRATHLNASDAPAMLGCSPYVTRSELLRQLHTGLAPEHDAATQQRFADGHRFEALARTLAEEIIGSDLYPCTGTEGELSASFDGLTMDESKAFEHKTLNAELRALMEQGCTGAALPKHYRVQMEQQLLVSGAERVLFMASKWDGENQVEERHTWYYPDPALRAEIVGGWKQFAVDLASYKPTEPTPVVVAQVVASLPAVSVRVDGALAVISNLPAWGIALREFIAKIPAKPSTDQEFADADSACKALKEAEKELDKAEANALGQITSVEEMTRMVADLRNLARTTRLASEKVVTARKTQIRTEEVQRGKDAFAEHLNGLNRRLGNAFMPAVPVDFAAAISGRKNIDSLKGAIDGELTRGKIEANRIADAIQLNLDYLREHAASFKFLFADAAQIVLKAPDDLQALVKNRIADHTAAEQKKADALREKIRAEEQAKAEKDAREKLEREQREAQEAEAARQRAEATMANPAPTQAPIAAPAASSPAPAANVVPLGTRSPAAPSASPPTLMLRDINARIAPLTIDAAGLAALGFPYAATDKAAWHENTFPAICDAAIAQLVRAKLKQAA